MAIRGRCVLLSVFPVGRYGLTDSHCVLTQDRYRFEQVLPSIALRIYGVTDLVSSRLAHTGLLQVIKTEAATLLHRAYA